MNQTLLVGRLTTTPEIHTTDTNMKYTTLTLAVTRQYKNIEGEYETDFIPIKLYNNIATQAIEYTRKGDLIGVRGRLQNNNYEKDGVTQYTMEVIAEKVSFLSSNKLKAE